MFIDKIRQTENKVVVCVILATDSVVRRLVFASFLQGFGDVLRLQEQRSQLYSNLIRFMMILVFVWEY